MFNKGFLLKDGFFIIINRIPSFKVSLKFEKLWHHCEIIDLKIMTTWQAVFKDGPVTMATSLEHMYDVKVARRPGSALSLMRHSRTHLKLKPDTYNQLAPVEHAARYSNVCVYLNTLWCHNAEKNVRICYGAIRGKGLLLCVRDGWIRTNQLITTLM